MYISEPEPFSSARCRTSPTTPTIGLSLPQSECMICPMDSAPQSGAKYRYQDYGRMLQRVVFLRMGALAKTFPWLHVAIADDADMKSGTRPLCRSGLLPAAPGAISPAAASRLYPPRSHPGYPVLGAALRPYSHSFAPVTIPRLRIDPQRRHALRPKSQIYVQHAHEAAHEQTRAHQQHAREGDFRNHQRATHPSLPLISLRSALPSEAVRRNERHLERRRRPTTRPYHGDQQCEPQ